MLKELFWNCIGMDIGTVNTLIAMKGRGIILREPSAVALSTGSRRSILAAGDEAVSLLGRTPGGVTVEYPLAAGVVADYELTEQMLKRFLYKAVGRRLPGMGLRVMACVPNSLTDVERRALEEALKGAGAREVFFLEEPLAAAVGAGLPIHENKGRMIVELGGGTSAAAVLALNGVVVANCCRIGGRDIDQAIIDHVRKEHGILIGAQMAEQIKIQIGSAMMGDSGFAAARGRDVETGLPREGILRMGEVNFAIRKPIRSILNVVRQTLAQTPPELAGDLLETGITLTGGTAWLKDLAGLIQRDTDIPTRVADAPLECVVLGTLRAAQAARRPRVFTRRPRETMGEAPGSQLAHQ